MDCKYDSNFLKPIFVTELKRVNIILQEIWIRLGSGTTARNVPLHVLAEMLGRNKCDSLLPAHILTGFAQTSKFGTKNAAITVPHTSLENFGREMQIDCPKFEETIECVERYLVQILKCGSECKSLDQLRVWTYLYGNIISLEYLPPTSRLTRDHILRAAYHTYNSRNCLNSAGTVIQLENFGYVLLDDYLRPTRNVVLYPNEEELVPSCSCGKCARKSCSCFRAGVPCCIFCKCNSVQDVICHNSFTKSIVNGTKRSSDDTVSTSPIPQKRRKKKSSI